MQTTLTPASPRPAPPGGAPPLQNGDKLSRAEFERRYAAMPGLKKAELLKGIVYMPSPVSLEHSAAHGAVMGWLGVYAFSTPGVGLHDHGTVRLGVDNEPQPDACLRILPAHGGQSRDDPDGYMAGSPELVVEVAASSVSYDLHVKFDVYRRHGVQEYVVWRTQDAAIDWFVLGDKNYKNLAASSEGFLVSQVFPGLWLDAPALLRGDLPTVLKTSQAGLTSPDHGAFVERLRRGPGNPTP